MFSTIKKWAAEFKHGHTNLEDDPRAGCPKSATTSEIIEQVYDMVLDDRRMKVRETAETVDISKERVGYNDDKAMYRSRFEMRMQGEVTI